MFRPLTGGDVQTLRVMDLGRDAGYREVLSLQEQVHAQRVAGECTDTLLMLEHRPV